MSKSLVCPYALGGINYKNGFVTSCPQQSDQLYVVEGQQFIEPSKIINSSKFKKHRKDLMSGIWPKGCHLCKEVEEVGGKSMRHDNVKGFKSLKHYNAEDGTIDLDGLTHIELRFSNSCNMACLHCSTVYSSGWVSKLKNYTTDAEDKKFKLIQLTKEFHRASADDDLKISISIDEMEVIVNDLNKNFQNLSRVDFAGGEVLYQKQFLPCLQKLAKHPNSKNMEISFHSNFNAPFDPIKLSTALEPFQKSFIHISVDSGTNIYSYFRTGNWNVLVNNINTFRSVNNFTELDVVCTTSAYQIMDIKNVFESLITLDVDIIDSSIVYTPRYINPAVMIFNFRENVVKDINDTKTYIKEQIKKKQRLFLGYFFKSSLKEIKKLKSALRAIDNIEQYILNCNTINYSDYESFLVYIRKTDELWKQTFNSHFKNYQYANNKIYRINK